MTITIPTTTGTKKRRTAMMKGRYTKPIGYIEKIGDCIIKKVSAYGKKYTVYQGQCFWRVATIQKARLLASERTIITKGYGKV